MIEYDACKMCSQRVECGMRGKPLVPVMVRPTSRECFYFVCPDGEAAARNALYRARERGISEGLIPFGTKHKKFRPRTGRWIASDKPDQDGIQPYAVYVRVRRGHVKVKNRISI